MFSTRNRLRIAPDVFPFYDKHVLALSMRAQFRRRQSDRIKIAVVAIVIVVVVSRRTAADSSGTEPDSSDGPWERQRTRNGFDGW